MVDDLSDMEPDMTLTDYLSEVSARAAKATSGPWGIHIGHDRFSTNPGPYGAYLEFGSDYNSLVSSWSDGTKEFVTHARQDVPKLVEMLRVAHKAILEMECTCGSESDCSDQSYKDGGCFLHEALSHLDRLAAKEAP